MGPTCEHNTWTRWLSEAEVQGMPRLKKLLEQSRGTEIRVCVEDENCLGVDIH